MTAATEAEAIARAEAAYRAGDFTTVRAVCTPLSASSDADVAARARALATRVETDGGAFIALGMCAALFAAVVVAYAT